MKLKHVLAAGIPLLGIVIAGCGGGGGGGDSGTTTSTNTTITSNAQGTTASASGTQSASLAANSATSLSNLATPISGTVAPRYRSPLAGKDARFNTLHAAEVKAMNVPKAKLAAAVQKARAAASGSRAQTTMTPGSSACLDGGTMSYSGWTDDVALTYSLSLTFANCRESGTQMNGSMTAAGSYSTSATGADSFTITVGSGDGLVTSADFKVEMFDAAYTNLYAYYLADMTVSGSVTPGTTAGSYQFSFTGNGKETYSDFISSYNLTLANFTISNTLTTGTGTSSGVDTVGGSVSESWTSGSTTQGVSIAFTSFQTTWSMTSTYYQFGIDGTVAVDFTPDATCNGNTADGTYAFATVTPFRETLATGALTQGHITINTTTHVQVVSGQVVVSVDGQTDTSTYSNLTALEATCPIQDMEDNSTSTNSGGSGTVASANAMLITLSWDTDATDLDLHLNYYSTTAPTASTAGTWYMDWHQTYQGTGGVDVNADGTGDVDLDYDDISGYGPEHITAKVLPAGYYVVSVNSYYGPTSTATTNATVTINVGGTLFTFPAHAFNTSDGESLPGVAAAWYRVADIRVNSDGSVNVLTPDTTLQAWHDGTFGMTAPAAAPKASR